MTVTSLWFKYISGLKCFVKGKVWDLEYDTTELMGKYIIVLSLKVQISLKDSPNKNLTGQLWLYYNRARGWVKVVNVGFGSKYWVHYKKFDCIPFRALNISRLTTGFADSRIGPTWVSILLNYFRSNRLSCHIFIRWSRAPLCPYRVTRLIGAGAPTVCSRYGCLWFFYFWRSERLQNSASVETKNPFEGQSISVDCCSK